MDPTSGRESDRAGRSWHGWRLWAVLLGAAVFFVVAFDLLERLVGPEPLPARQSLQTEADAPEPILPRITKMGQHGLRVDFAEGGGTVLRIDGIEGELDEVVACLEEGMKQSFANATPPSGLFARRAHERWMVDEFLRINNACSGGAVPLPPVPPLPPENQND
jgi:hypothetical protein